MCKQQKPQCATTSTTSATTTTTETEEEGSGDEGSADTALPVTTTTTTVTTVLVYFAQSYADLRSVSQFRARFEAALALGPGTVRNVAPAANFIQAVLGVTAQTTKTDLYQALALGVSFIVDGTVYTAQMDMPSTTSSVSSTAIPSTITSSTAATTSQITIDLESLGLSSSSNGDGSSSSTIGIAVGVSVGVLAVAIIVLAIVMSRRRDAAARKETEGEFAWDDNVAPTHAAPITDKDMEWDVDQLPTSETLGRTSPGTPTDTMSNIQLDEEINRQLKILRASYALEGSNPQAATEMLSFLETIEKEYQSGQASPLPINNMSSFSDAPPGRRSVGFKEEDEVVAAGEEEQEHDDGVGGATAEQGMATAAAPSNGLEAVVAAVSQVPSRLPSTSGLGINPVAQSEGLQRLLGAPDLEAAAAGDEIELALLGSKLAPEDRDVGYFEIGESVSTLQPQQPQQQQQSSFSVHAPIAAPAPQAPQVPQAPQAPQAPQGPVGSDESQSSSFRPVDP